MNSPAQQLHHFTKMQLGIDLNQTRIQELLERQLGTWLKTEQLSLSALLGKLKKATLTDPIYQRFVSLVSVQESYFFRSRDQLTALVSFLSTRSPDRPLRIWSIGCSHGAEVYSLSYLLSHQNIEHTILGTDICQDRINIAQQCGPYSRFSIRDNKQLRLDLFVQEDDKIWIHSKYRSSVSFVNHNILSSKLPTLGGKWDVILCRNLFIYFSGDTVNAVLEKLLPTVSSTGTIWLGANDALHDIGEILDVQHWGKHRFYQPATGGSPTFLRSKEHTPSLQKTTPLPPERPIPPTVKQRSFPQLNYCLQQELWSSAHEIIEENIKQYPNNETLLLTLGSLYARKHLFLLAEEQYTTVIEQHNGSAEAYYLCGLLRYKQKKWHSAQQYFDATVRVASCFWPAHLYLGLLSLRLNNHLQAEVHFEEAQELLNAKTEISFVSLFLPSGFHHSPTESLTFIERQLENVP